MSPWTASIMAQDIAALRSAAYVCAVTDPIAGLNAALADRYVVDRELGHGGMALVYLARDLKHERFVALKTLRPEIAMALGRERFLREIKLAARLQHPNILPVYDSGDAEIGRASCRERV